MWVDCAFAIHSMTFSPIFIPLSEIAMSLSARSLIFAFSGRDPVSFSPKKVRGSSSSTSVSKTSVPVFARSLSCASSSSRIFLIIDAVSFQSALLTAYSLYFLSLQTLKTTPLSVVMVLLDMLLALLPILITRPLESVQSALT